MPEVSNIKMNILQSFIDYNFRKPILVNAVKYWPSHILHYESAKILSLVFHTLDLEAPPQGSAHSQRLISYDFFANNIENNLFKVKWYL